MPDELAQVEAAYRAVTRGQGRVVCFHPTLPELPALFGVAGVIGPTGGTLRYDAIVSISPANKGLGSVHSRLTSERHYIKISHFPEPWHYLPTLRTENRV